MSSSPSCTVDDLGCGQSRLSPGKIVIEGEADVSPQTEMDGGESCESSHTVDTVPGVVSPVMTAKNLDFSQIGNSDQMSEVSNCTAKQEVRRSTRLMQKGRKTSVKTADNGPTTVNRCYVCNLRSAGQSWTNCRRCDMLAHSGPPFCCVRYCLLSNGSAFVCPKCFGVNSFTDLEAPVEDYTGPIITRSKCIVCGNSVPNSGDTLTVYCGESCMSMICRETKKNTKDSRVPMVEPFPCGKSVHGFNAPSYRRLFSWMKRHPSFRPVFWLRSLEVVSPSTSTVPDKNDIQVSLDSSIDVGANLPASASVSRCFACTKAVEHGDKVYTCKSCREVVHAIDSGLSCGRYCLYDEYFVCPSCKAMTNMKDDCSSAQSFANIRFNCTSCAYCGDSLASALIGKSAFCQVSCMDLTIEAVRKLVGKSPLRLLCMIEPFPGGRIMKGCNAPRSWALSDWMQRNPTFFPLMLIRACRGKPTLPSYSENTANLKSSDEPPAVDQVMTALNGVERSLPFLRKKDLKRDRITGHSASVVGRTVQKNKRSQKCRSVSPRKNSGKAVASKELVDSTATLTTALDNGQLSHGDGGSAGVTSAEQNLELKATVSSEGLQADGELVCEADFDSCHQNKSSDLPSVGANEDDALNQRDCALRRMESGPTTVNNLIVFDANSQTVDGIAKQSTVDDRKVIQMVTVDSTSTAIVMRKIKEEQIEPKKRFTSSLKLTVEHSREIDCSEVDCQSVLNCLVSTEHAKVPSETSANDARPTSERLSSKSKISAVVREKREREGCHKKAERSIAAKKKKQNVVQPQPTNSEGESAQSTNAFRCTPKTPPTPSTKEKPGCEQSVNTPSDISPALAIIEEFERRQADVNRARQGERSRESGNTECLSSGNAGASQQAATAEPSMPSRSPNASSSRRSSRCDVGDPCCRGSPEKVLWSGFVKFLEGFPMRMSLVPVLGMALPACKLLPETLQLTKTCGKSSLFVYLQNCLASSHLNIVVARFAEPFGMNCSSYHRIFHHLKDLSYCAVADICPQPPILAICAVTLGVEEQLPDFLNLLDGPGLPYLRRNAIVLYIVHCHPSAVVPRPIQGIQANDKEMYQSRRNEILLGLSTNPPYHKWIGEFYNNSLASHRRARQQQQAAGSSYVSYFNNGNIHPQIQNGGTSILESVFGSATKSANVGYTVADNRSVGSFHFTSNVVVPANQYPHVLPPSMCPPIAEPMDHAVRMANFVTTVPSSSSSSIITCFEAATSLTAPYRQAVAAYFSSGSQMLPRYAPPAVSFPHRPANPVIFNPTRPFGC
uniref:PHD-type domain-containing protein n=1 Tax=Trichuris muris TaxID=70415 RepID=A0A5S6R2K6_TRIMR